MVISDLVLCPASDLIESVSIDTRQTKCPWSSAWSKNAPAIGRVCECTVRNEAKTRRPRREYRQGRAVRERQQGVGVWRRDGGDCERPYAPGPVSLVMRSQ